MTDSQALGELLERARAAHAGPDQLAHAITRWSVEHHVRVGEVAGRLAAWVIQLTDEGDLA